MHDVPGPVNPLLHAQVNEPAVFVQSALVSQLSVPAVHSSSSKQYKQHCGNSV